MSERKTRYFLTDNDNIEIYENNLVTLKLSNGEIYEGLEPKRLFPVNNPNSYITLLSNDGKEIGVIRNLDDINEASKEVILNSIKDYYFIPFITEVLSVTKKGRTLIWKTITNRGPKTIEIRDRNHDIRTYRDGSVRVRDADDNRYIIPEYLKLDKHSLRNITPDL